MAQRVLVVDDDADLRGLLEDGLQARGFEAVCASSGAEALEQLKAQTFDVVLTDLEMPHMDGLQLARQIEASYPTPVILLTGQANLTRAKEALRAGVFDLLEKPARLDSIEMALGRALRHNALTEQVRRLQDASAQDKGPGASGLLGKSRAMENLRDLVRRIAPADVSILITGESGTGKEVVARQLHQLSGRSEGPFVAVNCAAVPANLLESELFGHAAGAFTGAADAKEGLFVRARGGTLFLDEVGEMPLDMQVKLLRALQEMKVRPVGAVEEIDLDVRVVAATNRDLEEEMDEGHFREDLYYRLAVVHVPVPPLRSRGADTLELAQHFLQTASAEMGRQMRGLMRATADRLLSYEWPGNVRELENAMQRACALARYEDVSVEDLPKKIRSADHAAPVAAPSAGGAQTSTEPEALPTLEEVERRHIQHVMQAAGGNKARAARILGVDRRTLYRKAERHGFSL